MVLASQSGMKDTSKPENKPEACEFCDFTTSALKPYTNTSAVGLSARTQESHKWLCCLCAATPAGSACEYPDHFPESAASMRTVCFVGNTILKELGKLRLTLDIAMEDPATREWERS